MKLKFMTEKTCWHNGKYYEEGAVVECDCKFCKEGSVPYFTPIKEKEEKKEVIENKIVSQETTPEKKIGEEVDEVIKEVEQELEKSKPKKRNKIEII